MQLIEPEKNGWRAFFRPPGGSKTANLGGGSSAQFRQRR
jgi:hypothetical protein